MAHPLVSIIIPCYNSAPWLSEAIDSALAQTWTEKEIIAVDDGSTDESRSILESYDSALAAVLFQENRGASAARNSGLKRARGEFIQFLDSDDVLGPDKIQLQMNRAQQQEIPSDYLYSCSWGRFRGTPDDAEFNYDLLQRDLDPAEFLILSWEKNLMMHPAAWLVPRKLIQEAGAWDETLSLNDDGEFFARVLMKAKSVFYIRNAKSYYRSDVSGSLSSSSDWDSLYRSYEQSLAALLSKASSEEAKHASATLLQRFIYTAYPDAVELRLCAKKSIEKLGGTDLKPPGGRLFKILASCIGWKAATLMRKRLQ